MGTASRRVEFGRNGSADVDRVRARLVAALMCVGGFCAVMVGVYFWLGVPGTLIIGGSMLVLLGALALLGLK